MRAPVVVDRPVLFPGYCRTCGRSKGRMVDTMLDDDIGRLYLCAEVCVPAFGTTIGLADTEAAEDKITDLQAKLTTAELELAEHAPVIAAIAKASEKVAA